MLGKILPVPMARGESERDESRQHRHLQRREHILHARGALDADQIQERDQNHQSAGEHLLLAEGESPVAGAKQDMRLLLRANLAHVAQIVGEGECRDGDGRGKSGEERNPSAHESPGGTVGACEINVFAAGAGQVHAELGVRERSEQRADRSDHPAQQDDFRRAEVAGQESGGGENPGADHARDDERDRAGDT